MNILQKIQFYCINPRLLEIANSDMKYYEELKYYYDHTFARNAMNDHGITLCLVNGVEYDQTIWFDQKKAIELFNRLCHRLLNIDTIFIGKGDSYNKSLASAMRVTWKVMLILSEHDMNLRETRLSDKELYYNTKLYYVEKKPKIVKYVEDNIEQAFEQIKQHHGNIYELIFLNIYPILFDNFTHSYFFYERRGQDYLQWLREHLALNYSKLLGNVKCPIHDILNDKDAIRLYPIVYSETYGLLYIYSDHRFGIENQQYWKLSEQQKEIMDLQILYFTKYVIKKNVDKMFILFNASSFGFQCKVDKIPNIDIDENKLLQIIGEINDGK